jgi:hypothetical protein
MQASTAAGCCRAHLPMVCCLHCHVARPCRKQSMCSNCYCAPAFTVHDDAKKPQCMQPAGMHQAAAAKRTASWSSLMPALMHAAVRVLLLPARLPPPGQLLRTCSAVSPGLLRKMTLRATALPVSLS